MIKKLMRLFLITVLLIGLLAACSEGEKETSSKKPEGNPIEGLTFSIYSGWYTSWDPRLKPVEDGATTLKEDALIAHNIKIENEYGITIRCVNANYIPDELFRDVMAGTSDVSLFDTNAKYIAPLVRSGSLYPWEDTGIDLSDTAKYYQGNSGDETRIKGQVYGVFPHYWYLTGFSGLTMANSKIMSELTGTSVYELHEKKQWTFDTFEDLLRDCSQAAKDSGIIPFNYYTAQGYLMVSILANGGNLVRYDPENSKYVFTGNEPNAVEGLEYARKLVTEGLAVPTLSYTLPEFCDGINMIVLCDSWHNEYCAGFIDGIDLISFPWGPGADYGKTCTSYTDNNLRFFVVPITADPDDVGMFSDIWMTELEDMPYEEILAENERTNMFQENSTLFYRFLDTNAAYNYSTQMSDGYDTLFLRLGDTLSGKKSVVSVLEQYSSGLTEEIEANLNR